MNAHRLSRSRPVGHAALWGVLLACGPAACGERPPPEAAGTESSTSTGDGSGGFVAPPDGGVGPAPCDFLRPDCPDDHKCVGYDVDGDAIPDETRCVPVVTDPRSPGDPCQWDPGSGADDCAAGSTCFGPGGEAPRCVPNCVSPAAAMECTDPDLACLSAGGPVWLCLPACDPRQSSCAAADYACYPSSSGDWMLCLPDLSGGQRDVGDPCAFTNACNPGLACRPAETLAVCEADSCCTRFCSIDGPEVCPASEGCVGWSWTGAPPSGLEDLGTCQRITSARPGSALFPGSA
jgi:hypothetical protein